MKSKIVQSISFHISTFLFLVIIACNKYHNPPDITDQELTISAARNYFNERYQQSTPKSTNLRQRSATSGPIYPYWRQATTYSKKGITYIEIPTVFLVKQSINVSTRSSKSEKKKEKHAPTGGIQRLLLYKNKTDGNIKEIFINYVPDEGYLKSKGYDISGNRLNAIDDDYYGFIVYTRVDHSPLFMLRIENGKAKRMISLNKPGGSSARKANNGVNTNANYECWEYCTEYWQETCWDVPDPMPGSPSFECGEPVYLYDICIYECFESEEEYDPGNPGEYPGENQGGFPIPYTFYSEYVHSASELEVDINDYLKCFRRNLGAKITIYSDQPVPNTRNVITTTNGIADVGHAFVSIEQTVNGVITRRTFGYYPSEDAKMFNYSNPHAFADDSYKHYDVKIEKNVGAQVFADILDMCYNATANYDLYRYNCTDFAIDIGRAAGLNIPYTKNQLFPGRNPGDLGQDMRNIPGADGTPGSALSNTGNCN
ncbi:hypothetical protein AAHN97_06400 [Chitinophaga niabensis]|uniref:hypothetical protein n=1 Tax=Chitinophaga niabensis TaxID=536979 RepID=UPI0031BA243C